MNNLVSVIVPVYKVEKYLKRCVDSIINQTYKNLEIILVDDGSPDNCPKMCDLYAKEDKRVKVIHKQNGGLSDARNAGLDIMTGDFVCFVDSDDWVEESYVEKMLIEQQKTDADIVACGINLVNEESGIVSIFKCSKETVIYEDNKILRKYFKKNEIISGVAWNKLYKKYIFEYLRYPKGRIYEDNAIILQILHKCKKLVVIKDRLYNYLKRQNSIMLTEITEQKLKSMVLNNEERTQFLIQINEKNILCKEIVFYLKHYCWIYRDLTDENLKNILKQDFKIKWNKYKKYLSLFDLNTYKLFYLMLKYKMLK